MASFKLRAPQRRKKNCRKSCPFPVPVESQTGLPASNHKWFYYTAYLINNGVFVKHGGDMEQLYSMGFFGKGTLSRHTPSYESRQPVVRRTDPNTGQKQALRVLSRRRYLQHLLLAKNKSRSEVFTDSHLPQEIDVLPVPKVTKRIGDSTLQVQDRTAGDKHKTLSSEFEGDKSTLLVTTEEITEIKDSEKLRCDDTVAAEPAIKKIRLETLYDKSVVESKMHEVFTHSQEHGESSEVKGQDEWPEVKGDEHDPWRVSTQEESDAFWGDSENIEMKECVEMSGDEKASENKLPSEQTLSDSHMSDTQAAEREEDKPEESNSKSLPKIPHIDLEVNTSSFLPECEDHSKLQGTMTHGALPLHSTPPTKHKEADTVDDKLGDNRGLCDEHLDKEVEQGEFDDRCLSDEEGGDVLVVDDSEDSDVEVTMAIRKPWRPVVKRDPWKVTEMLQLSAEEAFFLSYALGCLVVYDENEVALDISGLWRLFSEKDPLFAARYAVYHNLRSKGWVPKSGLKYGSDFVVYKQGPAQYHSTYSVIVKQLCEKDLQENSSQCVQRRVDTWTSLAALNRTTEQVSKELMLCYVMGLEELTVEERSSPKCLSRLKIQEVIVRRWMSKQERENTEHVLIP